MLMEVEVGEWLQTLNPRARQPCPPGRSRATSHPLPPPTCTPMGKLSSFPRGREMGLSQTSLIIHPSSRSRMGEGAELAGLSSGKTPASRSRREEES